MGSRIQPSLDLSRVARDDHIDYGNSRAVTSPGTITRIVVKVLSLPADAPGAPRLSRWACGDLLTTLAPTRRENVHGRQRRMTYNNGNADRGSSLVFVSIFVALISACHAVPAAPAAPATPTAAAHSYPVIGSIERLDPALDALVPPDAKIEKLAEGFPWAEGPAWTTEGGGALLFSDVPNNVIHRWKEGEGLTDFLRPGGYTGKEPRGGNLGPNGLTFDGTHHLIVCQHGDRRVARLEADRSFATVAGRFEGKRFNSPN